MLFRSALVCLAVTMVVTEKIYAVLASPRVHILTQMDGTTFQAMQEGDEWESIWQTMGGYTIVFDEITQNWEYATHEANGRLVPSTNVVGKNLPPKNALNLWSAVKEVDSLKNTISSEVITPQKAVSVSNDGQIPVIMVNFNDTTIFETTTKFDTMLFGSGNKTMKAYFQEVS